MSKYCTVIAQYILSNKTTIFDRFGGNIVSNISNDKNQCKLGRILFGIEIGQTGNLENGQISLSYCSTKLGNNWAIIGQ